MPAFRGYPRFALHAGLAFAAVILVLIARSAGWLNPELQLVLDWACRLYVVYRIASARVSPAYLLLWGPLAWLLPELIALVLFLFGGRKHGALAAAKKEVNRVAWRIGDEPVAAGNRIRMLGDRHGRDTLDALRAQILGARRRIHLSTYILSNDAVGREIVALLARRAREGVEVRLLLDAVGSWGAPLTLCRPLRRAGGRVAFFNPAMPLQGKGSANWRNHRKIAVFDGSVSIIGGQNIGLRYMGNEPSNRRFRDCSFLIEGPSAAGLERVFIADWCQATDENPHTHAAILRERPVARGEVKVEIIASGPDCATDPLWEHYVRLFSGARRSITIVTPYFIPDRVLFSLLVTAAHAGRRVRLIIPRRSDHRLVDFARRWYLRTLRDAGAEILFYKPDVLHAKLVIVDDEQLVAGSANLDMRSLFLNYEIGAVILDPEALREALDYVAGLEAESGAYSEDLYRRSRTWTGRAVETLSKVLAPLL